VKQHELVAVVLAIGLLFGEQIVDAVKGKLPSPAPVVVPVTPSPTDQEIVGPVKLAAAASTQRDKFANYFAVWSKIIEQNPGQFATVSAMNTHNAKASKAFIDAEPGGGVDELGPAIAVAMQRLLGGDAAGVQDRPITKDEALRVTRALEWACR
jgi:hypothetical protein